MNIKHINVLAEAEEDLEAGRSFYENQEQGIGEYFWDTLISDIESLTICGGVHTKIFGYYRMPSKRFPYSIYYAIKGDIAYIIAVLPEKRNPNWIHEKINKKS
ncbi:MAG: type II toxin-antitoxin system RelE/ParE family toxin [Gammaproteobacteria bacterium]|nr:type II toxin-antitoxin system RelE/ParE family toxin [Gammaproteobacteria bacterium]